MNINKEVKYVCLTAYLLLQHLMFLVYTEIEVSSAASWRSSSLLILLKCILHIQRLHVHFPSQECTSPFFVVACLLFISQTFETEVNMTSAHLVLHEGCPVAHY